MIQKCQIEERHSYYMYMFQIINHKNLKWVIIAKNYNYWVKNK